MNNQEILDEDQIKDSKEIIDKRTQNLTARTLIYLIIMLLGSYAVFYFKFKDTLIPVSLYYYKEMTLYRIIGCFILSFVLEFFRFLVRKFKRKKPDMIILIDPFWFQIIEGAFAIWILDTIIKIILLVIF